MRKTDLRHFLHFFNLKYDCNIFIGVVIGSARKNFKNIDCPLFRNERFMLDEMTQQNASKFAKVASSYILNMANFEVFCWVISPSINILFLKSVPLRQTVRSPVKLGEKITTKTTVL